MSVVANIGDMNPSYFYYTKSDPIEIWRRRHGQGRAKGRGEKVVETGIRRVSGLFYYVDPRQGSLKSVRRATPGRK